MSKLNPGVVKYLEEWQQLLSDKMIFWLKFLFLQHIPLSCRIWNIFGIQFELNLNATKLSLDIIISWSSPFHWLRLSCLFILQFLPESESHSVVSDSLRPHGLYSPWNSPGQNIGVDSFSLLQGVFPSQGQNPGLPHCGQILYQLSHKGSPRTLEWVAYPLSSGFFQPRNQTGVSCIAGRFFTNWAMREAHSFFLLLLLLSRFSRVRLCVTP